MEKNILRALSFANTFYLCFFFTLADFYMKAFYCSLALTSFHKNIFVINFTNF